MSFTAAELAEMAAADAEIEAEFALTAEEIRASRDLDRFAALSAKDNRQRSIAECKRRYRAANKAAAKCSSCDYRRALATLADAQVMGADCPRFGTEEYQQMDRRTQNGR